MTLGKQPPMAWDAHTFACWCALLARQTAIDKRVRIAARLAEVRRRTVYESMQFICGNCGDWGEAPMYTVFDCPCGYTIPVHHEGYPP